jgi:hypothetical protein
MNAIAPAAKPVLLMNATQAAIYGIKAYPYLPVITSPAIAAGTVVAVHAAAFISSVGVPSFATSS